jgi:hypothetical protein
MQDVLKGGLQVIELPPIFTIRPLMIESGQIVLALRESPFLTIAAAGGPDTLGACSPVALLMNGRDSMRLLSSAF